MSEADLPALMANFAEEMRALLWAQPDARALPDPAMPDHALDLVWDNCLLSGRGFRRAHVELFSAPSRFAVLHVCIFPHLVDQASIFGFDMIGGGEIATGLFLDFSAPGERPYPDLGAAADFYGRGSFAMPRGRPAWGDIFSAEFLAIRPANADEIVSAARFSLNALKFYLSALNGTERGAIGVTGRALQTAYVLAQRRNEHTLRMLSRFTSPQEARRFIDTVLFPLPGAEDGWI
jgi:hypothetical protein